MGACQSRFNNDPSKLGPSGGPITKDNTAVEYYCTLFAAAESPYEKDLIIVGSDDGLLHITRDAGKNWTKITPFELPEWSMINSISFDPSGKGSAYIAATRYKLGDDKPYLFKTKDYGKSWTKIVNGIDPTHFTRVIRVDPKRAGLLYAGTESGVYISFDDGASWKPFQLNLPLVPITDLTIKNDNLIAATQGRAFWMIDDITPLHQLNDTLAKSEFFLFKPMPSYRMRGGSIDKPSKTEGMNHPGGVMIHYFLKDTIKTQVSLEIQDNKGMLIKKFSTKPDKKAKEEALKIKTGINRFVWNMHYADAEGFDGLIMWAGGLTGPKANPGQYKAKLIVNGKSTETNFEIVKDPRTSISAIDMQEQFNFLLTVRDKLSETNKAVKKIRSTREQLNRVTDPLKDKTDMKELTDLAKSIEDEMKKIEEALYQTKNKSGQDPLNFPIRLNDKLSGLASEADDGDYKPTGQVKEVYKEISGKIDEQLQLLNKIFNEQIPKFNEMVKQKQISAVSLSD